jgi:hypothetical protein
MNGIRKQATYSIVGGSKICQEVLKSNDTGS